MPCPADFDFGGVFNGPRFSRKQLLDEAQASERNYTREKAIAAKWSPSSASDSGKYRNVWPSAIEDFVKKAQTTAWTWTAD